MKLPRYFLTIITIVITLSLCMGCRDGSDDSRIKDDASDSDNSACAPKSISAEFPFKSNYVQVLGSNMHYIDQGEGDVVLFLHGNPESVYSWRNIMPYLTSHARVIAVDLIGMGKSDKPDIGYYFADHAAYLKEFINALDLQDITLVGHDWGSGLAFHYATEHQDNVKGLAFMEAVLDVDYWENHTAEYQEIYQFFRSEQGKDEVVRNNTIVDPGIPDDVLRKMSEEEMDAYRQPFLQEQDRILTWRWVTEMPIEGQPANMHELVSTYSAKLFEWDVPMLLLYAEPGKEYSPYEAEVVASLLKSGEAVSVGPGLHYLMEDQPHRIGEELARWYKTLPPTAF